MLLERLKEKLAPERFTEMSGLMAAIVGCILGASFTEPELMSLEITSDGFVTGMEAHRDASGELIPTHSIFIGSADDLRVNWNALLDAAELTDTERRGADLLYMVIVKDYRRPVAFESA